MGTLAVWEIRRISSPALSPLSLGERSRGSIRIERGTPGRRAGDGLLELECQERELLGVKLHPLGLALAVAGEVVLADIAGPEAQEDEKRGEGLVRVDRIDRACEKVRRLEDRSAGEPGIDRPGRSGTADNDAGASSRARSDGSGTAFQARLNGVKTV